jgi:deoxyribodipyrimidine photolyase-related protein
MLPNVYGMILYADGGLFATKPYAAGSGYISRMSNHCAGCRYKPAVKTGPEACPFNYLYWNFFGTHRDRFARNPRIGMMIKTWDKKTAKEQQVIRREAAAWLDRQA